MILVRLNLAISRFIFVIKLIIEESVFVIYDLKKVNQQQKPCSFYVK